jgi:hypothetical protein
LGEEEDPRIFENSIFPAYVPEKKIIITPWMNVRFKKNTRFFFEK